MAVRGARKRDVNRTRLTRPAYFAFLSAFWNKQNKPPALFVFSAEAKTKHPVRKPKQKKAVPAVVKKTTIRRKTVALAAAKAAVRVKQPNNPAFAALRRGLLPTE